MQSPRFLTYKMRAQAGAFLLLFAMLCAWDSTPLPAQEDAHVPSNLRADVNFRESSNLDGNNVRTTVYNIGFAGSKAAGDYQFEFPKNTNRTYINLCAIWLAGEVIDEDGDIIQVVDFPTFRSNPQGRSWNMEPVPGFQNPNVDDIARSDEPATWPPASQGGWRDKRDDPVDPGWVGSWNGFFGKNIFNANQEMFYRTSDDLYTRHNYIPDETDPTRGGLGFIMDVRAMAWSTILIADVLFFIHDILNDGTKRIEKTSFLIWLADLVGGDAQDDLPYVDLQTSVAFLTDADRRGTEEFGGQPVGLGSVKYLETPGNPVDGIDNDGDTITKENGVVQNIALIDSLTVDPEVVIPFFTEEDFLPRFIGPGDKIVLIDSLTFERRIIEYPAGGATVVSLGQTFELPEGGITVAEDTIANQLDEDFDGLIDERQTLHLERFNEITGDVQEVRFINYLSFAIGDTVKRGFVVPGKAAAKNYQNVAPMIDESPGDQFDNDNDWNSLQDDLGLDGVENSGDVSAGENDGLPTSGAGTDFPGEPNIDKTDVSEVDMIGLTTALQDPAFGINFSTVDDGFIWRKFMTPGKFFIPRTAGESDTYVSSGFFPIAPGQRQRMAISVAMADGGATAEADEQSAIAKQEQARVAFESDYQFATPPLQVTVKAVPGDKKVTLYWDDVAEKSIDRYIERLGANGEDFQGYRIYRATDAAFLDAKVVTNASGVPTLNRPIAQFDKADGIRGLHPVDIQGVKFDLGTDSGLKHTFVDTGLTNGQRYFYAVTSYDFGYTFGNIPPSESSIRVDVDREGRVVVGTNVAVVIPRAPVAGYLPAELDTLDHVTGSSTGEIGFRIVDPSLVREGHRYQITFEDTLIEGRLSDVLTTKNFTLTDLTDNTVLMDKGTTFNEGDENPVIDGFQLEFINEDRVLVNQVRSRWSSPEIQPFEFSQANFVPIVGEQFPNDYLIVFGEVGVSTSKDTTISFFPLQAKDVNFSIYNVETGNEIQFGFAELNGDDGKFSINPDNANQADVIYFLEQNDAGELVYTWQLIMNVKAGGRNPEAGDSLQVFLRKPFLKQDVYEFSIVPESVSTEQAKADLNKVKVVPNPYVAAATWEPRNTFSSGRGPRRIQFIHLPAQCTIRIFNMEGVLVDQLEHESTLDDGAEFWNLLTRDELDIAYGIYVYHIDAPGIGEKTGTFAIIK